MTVSLELVKAYRAASGRAVYEKATDPRLTNPNDIQRTDRGRAHAKLIRARDALAKMNAARVTYEASNAHGDRSAYVDAKANAGQYASAEPAPLHHWTGWNRDASNRPIIDDSGARHVVGNPATCGLRFVGFVSPEADALEPGDWNATPDCGWNTDPDGGTFRDGSGLAWGIVAMLPGRNGRARFVAGMDCGDCEGARVFDLGRVFEVPLASFDGANTCPRELALGYSDVAADADAMAQAYAEAERDYRRADQLETATDELHARFDVEVLPDVVARYETDGVRDVPARSEAFNDWLDMLHRDGEVTDYVVENIGHPASCNA